MPRPILVASLSTAVVGAAAFAGVAFSGCSSDDLADVVLEGGTSVDALETMLEAKIVDSPIDAAEFTWPSNGDVISANPPPEFCWRQGAVEDARWDVPRSNLPSPLRIERPGPSGIIALRPERARLGGEPPSWFARWFGEGTAYAEGAEFSGRGFLLVISSSTDPELVRVFTTLVDYTPDPAKLSKLTSAKGTLKAVVTTAIFEDGVVKKTGGPFKGVPVTFTMAPPTAQ